MAKDKGSRVAAKKIKDKWKTKRWYTILTNDSFGKKEIGISPSSNPNDLIGRITEASLSDLTGDFKQSHIKLFFRIYKFEGEKAYTEFNGHEINPDYIRRLVRRRKTRIDSVVDVVTKDKVSLRLKPLIIVDRKIINNLETNIRNVVNEFMRSKSQEMTLDQFIVYMISQQVYSDLYDQIKVIYPAKRIEIRKSEILSLEDREIIEEPEEPEEQEEPDREEEQEKEEEDKEEEETGAGVA